MTKKQKILVFLILTPVLIVNLYNKIFNYSSNWFEHNQNFIKIIFLIISTLSSFWLMVVSKKESNKLWFSVSLVITAILLVYLYSAYSISSITF
jgi:hypothetical protein